MEQRAKPDSQDDKATARKERQAEATSEDTLRDLEEAESVSDRETGRQSEEPLAPDDAGNRARAKPDDAGPM
jgi:hypothetical protein